MVFQIKIRFLNLKQILLKSVLHSLYLFSKLIKQIILIEIKSEIIKL